MISSLLLGNMLLCNDLILHSDCTSLLRDTWWVVWSVGGSFTTLLAEVECGRLYYGSCTTSLAEDLQTRLVMLVF